jgi:hypothetical protein
MDGQMVWAITQKFVFRLQLSIFCAFVIIHGL